MRILMQPTIDRDERYCDKRCHRCRTVLEISTGDALDNADENGRITIECPVCETELHLKTFFGKTYTAADQELVGTVFRKELEQLWSALDNGYSDYISSVYVNAYMDRVTVSAERPVLIFENEKCIIDGSYPLEDSGIPIFDIAEKMDKYTKGDENKMLMYSEALADYIYDRVGMPGYMFWDYVQPKRIVNKYYINTFLRGGDVYGKLSRLSIPTSIL